MSNLLKKLSIILVLFFIVFGCKQTPTDNTPVIPPSGTNAVFILCEGTWGGDNSVLTRYDPAAGTVIEDYFGASNTGLRLGDMANNMAVHGDKGFITVSTARTVEAIDLKTGKSLGRLILQGVRQPRKICIINDSVGYVTTYDGNSVVRFDTRTMALLNEVKVGPVPEGIAYAGGMLFVANSGKGDIMKDSADAGTVYVLDEPSMQIIAKLKPGPNVDELIVNKTKNKLYAQYYHLYSQPDSLGGIVEYDLMTLKSVGAWRDRFSAYGRKMAFSATGDTLFYLNDTGVALVDLKTGYFNKEYIKNPAPAEAWYSIGYSGAAASLWIGNAMNYTNKGEGIVYKLSPGPIKTKIIETGIVPNTIVFY